MEKYDRIATSEGFYAAACEAERYLRELRAKLKSNRAYESVYDDHLAKFCVYNYFHGRLSLDSAKALVVELKEIASSEYPAPSEAFDAERFERCRQSHLERLISLYSPLAQP